MKDTAPERIIGYKRFIELILVITILSILTTRAISEFTECKTKAVTTHATGYSYIKARMDCISFYAFHGTWPENNSEAMSSRFHKTYLEKNDDYIKDFSIKNGAMTFVFKTGLPDKKLTIRPAVPAMDKLGPIIWVCGNERSDKEWHIFGKDRTDIDNRFIPVFMR